jgi:hypothetical protein
MGLLTDHEGEPVTFFLRGTFAPQYFGAIALEPLFDLGRIGITSRRHRHGNRFDGLAGQRPTGTPGVLAMTSGARGCIRLPARKVLRMQGLAACR